MPGEFSIAAGTSAGGREITPSCSDQIASDIVASIARNFNDVFEFSETT